MKALLQRPPVQVYCVPQHCAPHFWPSGKQAPPSFRLPTQAAGPTQLHIVLGSTATPEHCGPVHRHTWVS